MTMINKWRQFKTTWSERVDAYRNTSPVQDWFSENHEYVRALFEEPHVRDVVFGPIKSAIRLTDATTDGQVRSTIASVSLANAVMAGLPGKLGVGVAVSMVLEARMALRIARLVGMKIDKPSDIFSLSNLGAFGIVIGTIGWGFVHALRFVFSLIVLIPGVPATFVSEIIVTNFTGVLFWVGFEEAHSSGSFTIPKRMLGRVRRQTSELVRHQVKAIKGTLRVRPGSAQPPRLCIVQSLFHLPTTRVLERAKGFSV